MLKKNRVVRFAVVGLTNAAISFGTLNFCFYVLHQSKLTSSIIGTSLALLFSFALNRIYVFADRSKRIHKQFVPFALVSISGSLIVINIVYVIMLKILNGHEQELMRILKDISGLSVGRSFIDINVSTLIGAIVAMVWNYNGYKWFVFRGAQDEKEKHGEKITAPAED